MTIFIWVRHNTAIGKKIKLYNKYYNPISTFGTFALYIKNTTYDLLIDRYSKYLYKVDNINWELYRDIKTCVLSKFMYC